MRQWQRDLAVADAQLRARYFERLIDVAKVSHSFALECTQRATVEQMEVYLSTSGEKSHG